MCQGVRFAIRHFASDFFLPGLLTLVLLAQASCIERYDNFNQGLNVGETDRSVKDGTADSVGVDGTVEVAAPDVPEVLQAVCGDGQCVAGEDHCNCPSDCTGGCAGCCQGAECKAGTANGECGKNGTACADCSKGGKFCQEGDCGCKAQDHKGCSWGRQYWYDSCNQKGRLADDCDDGNACTDDSCSGTVCTHPVMPNGTDCGGGKKCQDGVCTMQLPGCGDGACNGEEDKCSCPGDCTGGCVGCCQGNVCKGGTLISECGKTGAVCVSCSGGKTCQSQACAYKCGDSVCAPAGNETCVTCPGDCGGCCPNGACDNGETCSTCAADCGECPGQCTPSCDPALEECVEATTGGWVCASKMVAIPAGNFWMGCNNCAGSTVNDTSCGSNEHPYHEVYLDAYEIDRTEVTAAQYLACKTAGGCTAAGSGSCGTYQVGGKEKHPINRVTWFQAEDYCQWVGKELCTEAQWEKGARGGCEKNGGEANCKAQSRKYPWGNETASCQFAVMYEGGYGCGTDSTMAVCSKSPKGDSPYGLCDMAGNVWEWTADWYQKDYYCDGPAASGDQNCTACGSWPGSPQPWSNPPGPGSGSYRVLRGGCFGYFYDSLRVSYRGYDDPSYDAVALGLRCCRSE